MNARQFSAAALQDPVVQSRGSERFLAVAEWVPVLLGALSVHQVRWTLASVRAWKPALPSMKKVGEAYLPCIAQTVRVHDGARCV